MSAPQASLSSFRLPVTEAGADFVVHLDGNPHGMRLDDVEGAISAFNGVARDPVHSARVRLDSNTRRVDAVVPGRFGDHAAIIRDGLRRRDSSRESKTTRRLDSIRRADAAIPATAGFYLARELEYIYPQVVEQPYPEMDGWTIFGRAQVDPGKKTHTYRRITRTGDAKIYIGGNEIPLVNSARDEISYPMHTLVVGAQWDIFEAMASPDSGVDKVREDMTAADRALHELGDRLIWHGNAANKFYGVLNTPGLPTRYSTVSFDGSASADDVLAALYAGAKHAMLTSKGTMRPDSVCFSPRVATYLEETRLGSVNDTTIMEMFLKHNGAGIKSYTTSWHLDGSGTGGRCGILFYKADPFTGIQNTIGVGFTMLPIQEQVFMRRVYFYMRLGGVVMRYLANQLVMWVECPLAT